MIKGVNRQMIEMTHTGSPYFERAFLVVRDGGGPSTDQLHRLAERWCSRQIPMPAYGYSAGGGGGSELCTVSSAPAAVPGCWGCSNFCSDKSNIPDGKSVRDVLLFLIGRRFFPGG